MGFTFGFNVSDDEGEAPTPATPPPPSALSSLSIAPENMPQEHSLDSVLDTLKDVKLTFDNYTTPVGKTLVYRRELFDVRHQVMCEDSEEPLLVVNNDRDLEKNVYEGGFKSWECSYDAVDKLRELLDKDSLNHRSFLEFGCGTSLPTCYLLRHKLESHNTDPVTYILSDFNYQVLRLVTVPNLLIHWASTLPVDQLVALTSLEERPLYNNDELLCTPALLQAFTIAMKASGITLRLVSGSWGPQFNQLVGPVEFLISSETIYSLDTLPVVAESVVELADHALVAAKNIYFGVGGSVIEFLNYLKRIHPLGTVDVEEVGELKRSLIMYSRMFRQTLQRIAVRSQSTVTKAAPRPLSNAHVSNLEGRWGSLPKEDQTALIEELKTRMELPWSELSVAEKKAAYYISFGEWGPRKPLHGPGDASKVFWGVVGGIAASVVVFAGIRSLGAKQPHTLERNWQEASDEYLKSKNANPFTGYSQIQ
ncbi:COX4-domain-containing protein [Suhomyces tanzawaensis NRRL Y-17324]|uniref:COX4-domain-containing protein n=1 Tax=Suhomyces tanzawaensis NRRL Y-17324 TaxID=984487 RepID=A0A1E4SBW2_9ASCO|nr:COX4-domain-containing protein [Suhomyces tanzawaensis NRRL Y-17324]ODV76882.1 COX4-domain-containing protein [Suhomyces tanzawaensis NRRL Y-17324]